MPFNRSLLDDLNRCKQDSFIEYEKFHLSFCYSGGLSDVIRFSITDGLNTGKTFPFRVRIKDISVHLVRNEALDVFPMMQSPVTPDELLV